MGTEDSRQPVRSYDRSWTEIEEMLGKAIARRDQWKKWFDQCSKDGDRDGMKEAARNHKALDGVINELDDAIIGPGDDFGFSGEIQLL